MNTAAAGPHGPGGPDTAQRKLLSPTRTTEIQAAPRRSRHQLGIVPRSVPRDDRLDGPTCTRTRAGPWRTNFSAIAHARAGRGLAPSAQRQLLSQGHRADDRSELEATLVPDSFHCK